MRIPWRSALLALGSSGLTCLALTLVPVLAGHRATPEPEKPYLDALARDGKLQVTPGLCLHVRRVEGRVLHDPVLKWSDDEGEFESVMVARRGEIRVEKAHNAFLIRLKGGQASHRDGSRAYFEDRVLDYALPALPAP